MGDAATLSGALEVVLCYCESDAAFTSEFSSGLESLRQERAIAAWRAQSVGADAGDLAPSDAHQVVVALLSPEFIATGFLQREGIVSRLNRRDSGSSLTVVPVLVRPIQDSVATLSESVLPPAGSLPLSEVDDFLPAIQQVIARVRAAARLHLPDSSPETIAGTIDFRYDSSKPSGLAATAAPTARSVSAPAMAPRPSAAPEHIGRYKIVSILGQGAFGAVYQAHDEQLSRSVAIKTPHPKRTLRPGDIESYMREARLVAQLDHPGIVPVYDVGTTDAGQFFVVSKVIEGKDLSKRLRQSRPSMIESARLVALAAEALHYAHQRDMVHRDVKPANILIGDSDGRPYIADFGLAIHESDLGQGPRRAGTPAYMSPEQARGESHRVDGRSDVFSLGVVLYELITGRLPFRNDDIEELLTLIARSEARPPRQFEPSIPRELERICLKAMANRIMDRYTTAQDFADDLWYFVNDASRGSAGGGAASTAAFNPAAGESGGSVREAAPSGWTSPGSAGRVRRSSQAGSGEHGSASHDAAAAGSSGSHAAARTTRSGIDGSTIVTETQRDDEFEQPKVVPKGLRAFDGHDAEFFLELVPGPCDRLGLPETIRFWKTRLEDTTGGDLSFSIGVIYGPSGCGKTSLVRAGLLPQLGSHVHVLFLDAAARDTEARLAQRLKLLCPDAPPTATLPQLMEWIRRGRGIPYETKLVLVIDQFEQWLQAHDQDRTGPLLDALGQCDGARVQCILMVRVDFMMSIHRFMNDLEAPIREGFNSAAVDLFGKPHARKVLRLFGRRMVDFLPSQRRLMQGGEAFLDRVVDELDSDGKIVPVHLALLAEMCKDRPWRPETLKALGGARGIGVTFLDETFESASAPLTHRVHENACRAALKCLMPERGSAIRGQVRSRAELATAAGYAADSREFDELVGVLDRDTRLITPIESDSESPAPAAANGAAVEATPAASGRYLLTHDYLVPSLREWLTKKQRQSARGRAELKLEEFSQLWNDRPGAKRLPGPFDWIGMRTLTRPATWTGPQRKMMGAAGRRLGIASAIVAATLCVVALLGVQVNRRFQEQWLSGTLEKLAAAPVAAVPEIVDELAPARSAAAPRLIAISNDEQASRSSRLNAALAALSLDTAGEESDKLIDNAYPAIVRAAPDDLAAMLGCVTGQSKQVAQRASREFAAADGGSDNVLSLAAVIAALEPNPQWTDSNRNAVAARLVAAPADAIGGWTRLLKPAGDQLAAPLGVIFTDPGRPAHQRGVAGDLLVAFTPEDDKERVQKLVDLLVDAANPEQFNRLVSQLEPIAKTASAVMKDRLAGLAGEAAGQAGAPREAIGRKQMHLAAAILRLDPSADNWKAFAHSADPTVRSLLIDNAATLGIEPAKIVARLKEEKDPGIRRALVLALGGFSRAQLKGIDPADFAKSLDELRGNGDAGLHAAAQWLIERWTEQKLIEPVAQQANAHDEAKALADNVAAPSWYVGPAGHDMVSIRGPAEFGMGSVENDPDREGGSLDEHELRHQAKIPRSYAIAAKETTVAQFAEAWKELKEREEFRGADGKPIDQFPFATDKAPDPACPADNVAWFHAAAYCNWLSKQAGIPEDQWCYSPKELFQHRLVLPRNYLTRTGYRLPTEAEWEYACRAGAGSGRFYGESPALLARYGWYNANGQRRTWPAGRLKPNDFGLFDAYGNVSEWCQDEPRRYDGQPYEDVEVGRSQLLVDAERLRVHRGGAFQYVPEMVTSAARDRSDPDYSYFSLGFRVARTFGE